MANHGSEDGDRAIRLPSGRGEVAGFGVDPGLLLLKYSDLVQSRQRVKIYTTVRLICWNVPTCASTRVSSCASLEPNLPTVMPSPAYMIGYTVECEYTLFVDLTNPHSYDAGVSYSRAGHKS